MVEAADQHGRLQACLDRLGAGDDSARDDLVSHACTQLTQLTRRLLRDYPGVHRWEQTDDVLQNAVLRLWKSLKEITPRSLPEFFSLAALHLRRELIDLARTYYGPEGRGAHHASHGDSSAPGLEAADETHDPAALAAWTDFHRKVETLPDEERAVFDLLWYQGLSHAQAAVLLQISERTLRRRWRSARLRVYDALRGRPTPSWANPPLSDD